MSHSVIYLFFDGACRRNPGPSGCGAVVQLPDESTIELSSYCGITTNNVAEYQGLLLGLARLVEVKVPCEYDGLVILGDSKLVVMQVRGEWKIKAHHLQGLHAQVLRQLEKLGAAWTIEHIPRELNSEADRLANKGIDDHAADEPRTSEEVPEPSRMDPRGIGTPFGSEQNDGAKV